MSLGKGRKMIPEWILYVLLGILGIAAGIVIYYNTCKQYHLALWIAATSAIVLILVITLFIRNELVKSEVQAKTPVYFGELVPANDPVPPLPEGFPKNMFTLMLGDNLRVLTDPSENYLLFDQDEPFLSIGIKDGMMKINTSITDSNNQDIVLIINNEFKANKGRAFNPKQPDKHSLIVRDLKGVEVLNIRFLNPRAIRIVGRFFLSGSSKPIIIDPVEGLRLPGGYGISNLTFVCKKGGLINFKGDTIDLFP